MNLETKVGIFFIASLSIALVGIMKLSDVRLERRYKLYFIFEDIKGIQNKSPIKIAGVEIGRVDGVELDKGRAKVRAKIKADVPIYQNGKVKVKLTSIIGSQFLDVDPGTPEAPQLKEGDILYGESSKTFEDIMQKFSELIDGKAGKAGLGDNLNATVENLRSITDALNEAIGYQRKDLKDMIQNLHQFSVDLKGLAADLHNITSTKKEDIEVSITKLRSLLERLDDVIAKVQKGEGSVGKLLTDKEMGDEVKQTVTNLKDTSESAKQVLNRFTKVRSFWEFEVREAPGASALRGDAAIRLQPRDHKYYYLGVNNVGNQKDEFRTEGDYEKKNTITALLGKEFGPVTVELGAIRSSAGIGLKYVPFDSIGETSPYRWSKNIELNSQAFDFGRDEIRGLTNKERRFKSPHFNVGAKYKINRWVDIGASVEDLAEIKQVNVKTHVVFEDKDLAYLFGFVSFAR